MNPHVCGCAAALPPEGARATEGHAGAPSWPVTARREAR